MLVDFWTYSCINCLRAIPYVRAWAEKYKDQGLVVIGVHAPEFAFEKNIDNVTQAVADLAIDLSGRHRQRLCDLARLQQPILAGALFHRCGRAASATTISAKATMTESERVIQQLLAEAGKTGLPAKPGRRRTRRVRKPPADMADVRSPETYVGYDRAENFVSPGGAVQDARHVYAAATPRLNEWGARRATGRSAASMPSLNDKDGSIVYRFHARDLHLVLGPAPDGKPVRFRVTIDGEAPGDSHGADVDAEGKGVVDGQRLYQLVRQSGADHRPHLRDPSSSIPACRPTHSPSAETGADP